MRAASLAHTRNETVSKVWWRHHHHKNTKTQYESKQKVSCVWNEMFGRSESYQSLVVIHIMYSERYHHHFIHISRSYVHVTLRHSQV